MGQVSFNQLLDGTPLYTEVDVSSFLDEGIVNAQTHKTEMMGLSHSSTSISDSLRPKLYCGNEGCMGYKFFEMQNESHTNISLRKAVIHKLIFRCCNCTQTVYEFYLKISSTVKENTDNNSIFKIQKVGQFPRHGKTIPNKASKLIGKERNLFFKGSISENQGMGIGAFSYYRRVLDSQKDKIFDEIIKVLNITSGNELLIQEITKAKAESQFTSAVNKIKTALPDGLKINGHNPLTLLYSALSEGLHSHSDKECLENAQDIKIILFEFSERLDSALKESAELSGAINRLARKGK